MEPYIFFLAYTFANITKVKSLTLPMKIALSILFIALYSTTALSQNIQDNPKAREIFEEVDRRRDKISSEQADMQMIIYDGRGNSRKRSIQSFSSNEESGSKSLLIFEEPANVRGTAFLSISEDSDEIQKLYLPALKQIQIISASEKGDRFMGSDFTYEDLGDQDPEDYSFELQEESDSAYVLKAEKNESSQYSYIYFYVDADKYVLQQAEYFNEEGKMIKRLEASDYENLVDNVWQPGKMIMFDLRNDRKTELNWSNRNVNASIPSWRFTERGLRRGL